MFSASVIFIVPIFLIQYAFSQRVNVNGPTMLNKGLQYGSNNGHHYGTHNIPIQGPTQHGAVINGPGKGPIGSNLAHVAYGQSMSKGQAFAGMPNHAFAGTSMQKPIINSAGKQSQFHNGAGISNQAYGGSGNGKVDVNGELPVSGMTSVTGHVPLTGKVAFNGNVPCNGIVTISGSCASCGQNDPHNGQMPAYGNKPYRH